MDNQQLLEHINKELKLITETLQRLRVRNDTSDMIFFTIRKAELLLNRSELLEEEGQFTEALESAVAVQKVLGKLGNIVDINLQKRREELVRASKAQAQRLKMSNTDASHRAIEKPRWSPPKANALDVEELACSRRWNHSAPPAPESYDSVSMHAYWQSVESRLDVLVAEIASRIAEARTIVSAVPFQNRFEGWLFDRLNHHLNARSANSPVDDRVAAAGAELIREATVRGRDLQESVWYSPEMLRASDLYHHYSTIVTDEELAVQVEDGVVLGLPHPDRPSELVYPKWQFQKISEEGTSDDYLYKMSVLREILAQLRTADSWARWNFLSSSSDILLGLSPLQVLRIRNDDMLVTSDVIETRLDQLRVRFGSERQAISAATKAYLGEDE